MSGSTLYAGGNFTTAGGVAANYIAKWDGSSWSALGSGMNERVIALAVSGSTVYAGGFFTTAGDSPANYVAQWDGSSWSDVGFGVSGGYFFPGVWALAASGNNLFVGGVFAMAGDTAVNNIAQWDGSSWSALDSGMSGDANGDAVYALAFSGSTLFAGGLFSSAGYSPASYIAQWDGSSWAEVGFGGSVGGSVDTSVYALAASGGNLYVGGGFTTVGGITANNIAVWNGSSWSALGSGIDGSVYSQVFALAVSGSDLYVGGGFTTAGGIRANNIAKWDGSSWSALASGMLGEGTDGLGPWVEALEVSGDTVYAGGDFRTAGGVAANGIAKWNGSRWLALGSGGFDGWVGALAVSGSDVYAAGGFSTAGGVEAANIAKWDGSSWSALGSGMDGDVSVAGGVGHQRVCGWRFHDGRRHRGQQHCQMGREQLVSLGFGDERRCECAGGFGKRSLCGG